MKFGLNNGKYCHPMNVLLCNILPSIMILNSSKYIPTIGVRYLSYSKTGIDLSNLSIDRKEVNVTLS